jgi:hypothetical protein
MLFNKLFSIRTAPWEIDVCYKRCNWSIDWGEFFYPPHDTLMWFAFLGQVTYLHLSDRWSYHPASHPPTPLPLKAHRAVQARSRNPLFVGASLLAGLLQCYRCSLQFAVVSWVSVCWIVRDGAHIRRQLGLEYDEACKAVIEVCGGNTLSWTCVQLHQSMSMWELL